MRFLIALAVIAITVYSVIDCVRAEDSRRRGLPTWLWVTVIIVLPGVGGLVWLLVSSMGGEPRSRGYSRPTRPLAPDDDPDFLAGLSRHTPPRPPANPPAASSEEEPPAEPSGDDGAAHPDQEEDRGRRSPE